MANKPKHEHSDRDRIYTPEQIVKTLISKIPAKPEDSWCDCCYGKGVFFNNFPTENKDFFEIDMGKDFLTSDKKFDWIVTNIPFSQPKTFIQKMSDNCIKGFGILCLANSMTASRLKELEKKGLFLNSASILYIKDWGFGYRTDFYVFTKERNPNFEVLIQEKTKLNNKVGIPPKLHIAGEGLMPPQVFEITSPNVKQIKEEDSTELAE